MVFQKKLTDEQRALNRKITQMKYRASHGVRVGIGSGRPSPNYGYKTIVTYSGNNVNSVTEKEPVFKPQLNKKLTKDSKIEDIIQWCMDLAESLKNCPNPAAWASALQNTLKIIQILDSRLPPPIVEPKPRPRVAIVIEEE